MPELLEEWQRLEAVEPARAARLAEPIRTLENWDYVASVDSWETTLFVLWADRYLNTNEAAKRDRWARVEVFEEVVKTLIATWGTWRTPWGELNRVQRPDASGQVPFDDALLSLPVAGAPGWLGSVFTSYTRQPEGRRRRYGVHGNSFVKIIEFGPQVRARSILTFGQSGNPTSPHFFDQAPLYSRKMFKPAWFSLEEIEARAARVYQPGSE